MAEAEAAHKAEVQRIISMKMTHEAATVEEALIAAEKSRPLHAELHAKLQEMAATEAAATLPFSERRERMARESMAVSKQPRLLQ